MCVYSGLGWETQTEKMTTGVGKGNKVKIYQQDHQAGQTFWCYIGVLQPLITVRRHGYCLFCPFSTDSTKFHGSSLQNIAYAIKQLTSCYWNQMIWVNVIAFVKRKCLKDLISSSRILLIFLLCAGTLRCLSLSVNTTQILMCSRILRFLPAETTKQFHILEFRKRKRKEITCFTRQFID